MKLSVVTTMYRSAPYIKEFYEKVLKSAQKITDDYEIIFVNDGSPDNSLEVAVNIHNNDPKVKVVDLSRNFGHHKAILAGLSNACGEKLFLLDCDLEESPELLEQFWQEMENSQADVVFGLQKIRNYSFYRKFCSNLFYKLFNLLSDTQVPENPCTIRLMNTSYVKSLLKLNDKNIFLAGSFDWTGYKQKAIYIDKINKKKSTYNLRKMFSLFVNAITSFSSYPLKLAFFVGTSISFISGLIGLIIIIKKLLYPNYVQLGYSSIIVSIWFLSGLIIFFLGVIGIYLSKIFIEVKDRPIYIIKNIYER